jgi:PAS domain-containing protein
LSRLGTAARVALAIFAVCCAGRARAQLPTLPRSLVTEALSDPKPFTFHVADFATEDFTVDRIAGDAVVDVELERGSLRWVRAGRVLVPRAVLRVRAPRGDAGVVAYAGFFHPMQKDAGQLRVELPVALLSNEAYPIRVELRRAGEQHVVILQLRFAPRPAQRGSVLFDSSCSPYGLRVRRGAAPADAWLYVGCRLVQTDRGGAQVTPTLELYMLFDHAGQTIAIDGVTTTPVVDSLFSYRVSSRPGRVQLEARRAKLEIEYRLPERLHAAFLALGVGPYYYALRDQRVNVQAMVPLATLYAGYAFNASARVVYFNASAVDRFGYADQGLYLWVEQLRVFDERLSLNLLLGAHLLLYRRDGRLLGRVSAPQGFEIAFRDFLGRNHNLTSGAFLYPRIFGRSYYNVWVRWGTPELFGEINFIDWHEPHTEAASESRSLGLSFGTTILRFL